MPVLNDNYNEKAGGNLVVYIQSGSGESVGMLTVRTLRAAKWVEESDVRHVIAGKSYSELIINEAGRRVIHKGDHKVQLGRGFIRTKPLKAKDVGFGTGG